MSDKLDEAKTQIITRAAFFASILLKQDSIPNPNVQRFRVDGETIQYNPQYVREQTKEQLWFDLLVASAHNVLKHPFRAKAMGGDYDKDLFNHAAGITAINTLHDSGFTLPEGYTYEREYKDWAVERVYRKLKELADEQQPDPDPEGQPNPDTQPQDGDGDGDGGDGEKDDDPDGEEGKGDSDSDDDGDGDGDGDGEDDKKDDGDGDDDREPPKNMPCDVHEVQAKDQDELQYKEAKADMSLHSAAMAGRSQGDMSANLERLVRELKDPAIPPEEIINRFVCDTVREGNDWNRRNKRHMSNPVFMPRKSSLGIGNDLIIAWDTSCSITERMVNKGYDQIFSSLAYIEEYGSNPKVTAIYCDTEVCGVEELSADDKPNIRGGGGTRFAPVFDYIMEHDLQPKGVIYFTDGELWGKDDIIGKNGRDVQNICPILWVLVEEDLYCVDDFKRFVKEEDFGEVLTLPNGWDE